MRVKARNDDTIRKKNRLKWNECSQKESGFQSSWHFSCALILNATPNEEKKERNREKHSHNGFSIHGRCCVHNEHAIDEICIQTLTMNKKKL